ncbi:MAG: BadF/BadG/BcrA/BcrD ATPase family protein [Chloroflexota bacterium]
MSNLFLGIDGGGSKTLALIADEDGNVIGRGSAESSNYHSAGKEKAFESLNNAIRFAFDDAKLSRQNFHAACIGLAGVDRPQDRAVIESWAKENLANTPVKIVNDAELVLAAGTADDWGVAMICGTGSIVYGRNKNGETTRAGGWGYLLGDEGSGYRIGLAALQAIVRSHDGRDENTILQSSILNHLSLSSPTDLIKYIYRQRVPTTEIAALASFVEEAAENGDTTATRILQEAAHELSLAAKSVVRQLRMTGAIPCAQAGGVITRGKMIAAMFRESAHAMGLALHPIQPVIEPAQGAIRLAQKIE